MTFYKNYKTLADSNLYDSYVKSYLKNSLTFICLLSEANYIPILFLARLDTRIFWLATLYTNLNLLPFFLPLYSREYISNVHIRRILGWWSVYNFYQMSMYRPMILFLTIEIIRDLIRFGLPALIIYMSDKLQHDKVAETFIKRVIHILNESSQGYLTKFRQLSIAFSLYEMKDGSEGLSDDEWNNLKLIMADFHDISFFHTYEYIILGSCRFILQVDIHGQVYFKNNHATQLRFIQRDTNDSSPSKECVICKDCCDLLSIHLQCDHYYCAPCIIKWIVEHNTCPLCRGTV